MGKGGKRNRRAPDEDDFDCETASMVSASTRTTNVSRRSGASSAFSNLAAEFENFDIDDVDSQLDVGISLMDVNNSKKQEQGMDLIAKCMRGEYPLFYIRDNWQTISTGCFRILRSGKDKLCEKACQILGILCFYLEPGNDGNHLLNELNKYLIPYIREEQSHHKQSGNYDVWSPTACTLLGVATRILDLDDPSTTIQTLWQVACSAARRSSSEKAAAALRSACLISYRLTPRQCKRMLQQTGFLKQCLDFLQDESAGVIAECATLLANLLTDARHTVDDATEDDIISLAEVIEEDVATGRTALSEQIETVLETTATQNEKSRSQNDNKLLKKRIRRINSSILDAEYDPMPDINIGLRRAEMLKLQDWKDENLYNSITFFFKGGTQYHLRLNECMRGEFDLGEPRVTAFGQSLSSDEDEIDQSGRPLTNKEKKDRQLRIHGDNKRSKGDSKKKGRNNKHNLCNEYD